jgi:hypothetical protein
VKDVMIDAIFTLTLNSATHQWTFTTTLKDVEMDLTVLVQALYKEVAEAFPSEAASFNSIEQTLTLSLETMGGSKIKEARQRGLRASAVIIEALTFC